MTSEGMDSDICVVDKIQCLKNKTEEKKMLQGSMNLLVKEEDHVEEEKEPTCSSSNHVLKEEDNSNDPDSLEINLEGASPVPFDSWLHVIMEERAVGDLEGLGAENDRKSEIGSKRLEEPQVETLLSTKSNERMSKAKHVMRKYNKCAVGVVAQQGCSAFPCADCGLSFASAMYLKSHATHCRQKSMHGYKNQTSATESSSLLSSDVRRTVETNSELMRFSCEQCYKAFSSAYNLERHRRTHSGERHCECQTCGAAFIDPWHLQRHIRIHTGERPFRCKVCGESFVESGKLKRHERIHSGERPYRCEVCGMDFRVSSHLKTHRRIHTGERPYQCTECNLSFTSCSVLHRHRRKQHNIPPVDSVSEEGKNYPPVLLSCELCQKIFSSAYNLERHMRMHRGEKPYKCQTCTAMFGDTWLLKRHERTHTGERPYRCDICSEAFIESCKLKRHMRVHTGERPYRCETCGTEFKVSSHLTMHKRIHTGIKPYQCGDCDKAFARSSILHRHRRRVHGIPVPVMPCLSSASV